jgi:quercetin dioxygenase-like cupin family protein
MQYVRRPVPISAIRGKTAAAIPSRTRETIMIAKNSSAVEEVTVGSVHYRGVTSPAKGVTVRWLSKVGQDSEGSPAYGLRLFTIGPGGEIPIHNHVYVQTMYIVSGTFECWEVHPDTDEILKKVCGPGDMVYVPSLEPHGMRNMSDDEPGQFLCCICTLEAPQICPG